MSIRTLPIRIALGAIAVASVPMAQTTELRTYKESGPAGKVHYDLATGRITKLVRPRMASSTDRQRNPGGAARARASSFQNTLLTGYSTTTPAGVELIDWAAKDTGLRFMTAFSFSYSVTTSIGLPGGALDLSFYEGTSGGNGVCNLGNEIFRARFVGLPGTTSTFGGSYNVTSFLAQNVCVPTGQIGWGYTSTTGRVGPRLTDFGTNTGWSDSFQQYTAPASLNTCQGTFWFGGCSTGNVPPPGVGGTPCASFYLSIHEAPLTVNGLCVFRSGGNPANFIALAPPAVGAYFKGKTLAPVAAWVIAVSPLTGVPLAGIINGTLLCDPTTIIGGVRITRRGTLRALVPKNQGLLGMQVFVQAAELVGPSTLQLTNALDCTIGG